MTFKKTLSLILVLYLLSIASIVFSQNDSNKRTFGLSATLQGIQYGMNLPIWLGERATLGPSFQLIYAEEFGTDIGLGLVSKIYIKHEKISPYAGFKIGFISNMPNKTIYNQQKTITDLYGGIAVGGEYFFDRQFSINVEFQGNVTKSNADSYRFGNPGGVIINTATMVAANIYF